MEEPKLHGWITTDYAMQIVDELLEFLNKNKIYPEMNWSEGFYYGDFVKEGWNKE